MKIAILTFYWSCDNYGQQLQAYALQKFLQDAGHEAFLVRYNASLDVIKSPLWLKMLKALNPRLLFNHIKFKYRKFFSKKENDAHPRRFEEFRKNHIAFSPIEYDSFFALKQNPPKADLYIVGSDQVWNFYEAKRCRGNIHAYFLDFGDEKIKRASYAASFGRAEIPKSQKNEIAPLIKKFDFVTVREKSGVDLCREFDCSAKWVCDPTLLLEAKTYRALYEAEGAAVPKKPYLLFYYLENGGDFKKESVFRFALERGLEVQYVSGNGNIDKYKKNFASVPEWLCLVDGAEFVITNSFHCALFSILFEKKFGAIKITGKASGMNLRLESLFEMTGTRARYVTDKDFSALDAPPFFNADFLIKKQSIEMIKEMIGGT